MILIETFLCIAAVWRVLTAALARDEFYKLSLSHQKDIDLEEVILKVNTQNSFR